MTDRIDPSEMIENEWYAVRHSGEIPEVALHSAFYYLTEDLHGPGLELTGDQQSRLVEAAAVRYREIILRDLQHVNRETSTYRGIERSIVNWERYLIFCQRHQVKIGRLRDEVAEALVSFIHEELADVESGSRETVINCTLDRLCHFIGQLGLSTDVLPNGITPLCIRKAVTSEPA